MCLNGIILTLKTNIYEILERFLFIHIFGQCMLHVYNYRQVKYEDR